MLHVLIRMTVVLLSRFVVNIREASRGGSNWLSSSSNISDIVFVERDCQDDSVFCRATQEETPGFKERVDAGLSGSRSSI